MVLCRQVDEKVEMKTSGWPLCSVEDYGSVFFENTVCAFLRKIPCSLRQELVDITCLDDELNLAISRIDILYGIEPKNHFLKVTSPCLAC